MTTKYSAAELAARDAVIQALYDNVPQNTLCELWRHYLGLRCIAETTDQKTTLGTDNITFTSDVGEYPYNAAAMADYSFIAGGSSNDTISFGDLSLNL
jgi:hypothetical protein